MDLQSPAYPALPAEYYHKSTGPSALLQSYKNNILG